ncbi:BatD family protein [Flavobacterium sp.]|uniref:BatD family protein n=1 Tax=Flavobacterium sp. TaxID=239 RepID=UPI00286AF323|nr:BatD family protein [Flavobacterium sp.]
MKKYIIILLLTIQGAFAQVQFVAQVSKNSIGINERLRIDFAMNEDGDNFIPPSFEGFKIVGGPSQSVSYQWVNGKKSFEKTYSYYLIPLKKGVFTIKQSSIEIAGQVYKTNPIKIIVGNAVAEERDPYDPYANNPYYQQQRQQQQQQQQAQTSLGKEGVHLVAEISNPNPYLNEPITVVYKIYVSNRSGVRSWNQIANPKYSNFWSQNIDIKQLSIQQGKFKGEDYRYAILRKTVLYPQKSGKLEIAPLSLDIEVEIPTGEVDFFGRQQMTIGTKRVSAGAKTINVKPLPETGKPSDFSGAVGNFDFKVVPSKTKLKNGESLDLNVIVSGKGNLKLFTLPKPVVPSSLEMYDPVHKENVTTPLTGMTGSISDVYTVIPQFKGSYPIQSIEFSYFDLGTKTYKTITSQPINIEVLDGPTATGNDAVSRNNTNKTKVSENNTFAFIKLNTSLSSLKTSPFLGSILFYVLLMLPFLIIPLIMAIKKKKEAIDGDVVGNRIKLSNKLAKKYLSEAKNQLENKEQFYIALEKALHNFLKAKLHIETTDMSKDKITEILLKKNANVESVKSFINLTENCEFARYAPSTSVSIQQDFDKAVSIISELEKQIS